MKADGREQVARPAILHNRGGTPHLTLNVLALNLKLQHNIPSRLREIRAESDKNESDSARISRKREGILNLYYVYDIPYFGGAEHALQMLQFGG